VTFDRSGLNLHERARASCSRSGCTGCPQQLIRSHIALRVERYPAAAVVDRTGCGQCPTELGRRKGNIAGSSRLTPIENICTWCMRGVLRAKDNTVLISACPMNAGRTLQGQREDRTVGFCGRASTLSTIYDIFGAAETPAADGVVL
jgi:hypothetical protein